jgi:hypothetical protein
MPWPIVIVPRPWGLFLIGQNPLEKFESLFKEIWLADHFPTVNYLK